LFLHYPEDKQTFHIDDQVLIGRYLMAAPILKPGQTARQVYLPEGVWYDWWDGYRFEGGRYILADAPLNRMPLYVRAGAVIPMGPAMQYVGEKPLEPLSLHLFPGDQAEFTLYEDDGISLDYTEGKFVTTRYQLRGDDHTAELEIFEREGNYEVPVRSLHVILRDGRHYQQKQFVDSGTSRIVQFERMIGS
jgi:alpha-glucosidase